YGTGYFYANLNTVGTQSITVTDKANPALTATKADIRVNPSVGVSGQNASLVNQPIKLTLQAGGGTSYRFDIDWNNDGVVDQTVSGPSGTTVEHTYSTSGWTYAVVTATVTVGGQDYTSSKWYQWEVVYDVTATVQTDPGDATKSALVVQGSSGGAPISLSRGSGNPIDLYRGG